MIKIRFFDNNYFLMRFNGNQEDIFEYLAIISKELINCGRPNFNGEYGWIFFISNLEKIKSLFNNIVYENEYIEPIYSQIGKNMLLQPYDYQKEAIHFAIERQEALLVLPCGSGKTPICVGIYLEAKERGLINGQGLIVVKASLKSQWKKEVSKFSNYNAEIIQTYADRCSKYIKKQKKIKSLLSKANKEEKENLEMQLKAINKECEEHFLSQFNNSDLLIANYETLVDKKVLQALKDKKLECVLCDEIHYVKTHTNDRSKALYNFNDAKIKIGATATPITKDPLDVFGIYKFIKPDLFNKVSDFNRMYIRYAGFGKICGFKNLDKLKNKISNNIFVKTKEEVASQLPKLKIIPISINVNSGIVNRTNEILEEIDELNTQSFNIRKKCKSESEVLLNEDLKAIDAKILALQTFAQEIVDSPLLLTNSESDMSKQYAEGLNLKKNEKLEICLEKVKEIIDSNEKVIIFSRYERMQSILADAIKKMDKSIKIAFVNGKLSSEKRYEEAYDKFKDNSEYKVLLCSDAGAEGLNMGHCKYLIEYDLAVSYAIQTQRHGRLERADSVHDNVIVYQLIANDSWDTIQQKIVEKKEGFDMDIIKSLAK